MSIYITSDLHGDYDRFIKLLKKIKFNEQEDKMYILGDVLDRGKYGIKLLNYIRKYIERGSMFLIKGNHELFAEMYLKESLDRKIWKAWGGEYTINEITQMSYDEQYELRKYLESLEYYILCTINDRECVLTHSGINADFLIEDEFGKIDIVASIECAVKKDEFQYLVSNDIHNLPASKYKKFKQYVIVGHTPVMRLNENGSYEILIKENYMDIDTGAGHRHKGGKMSCMRIDDMNQYYI